MWKESGALFPSRHSERMSDRSVRNVVTKAAELANVRLYRIEGGRREPSEVSPHMFRQSTAFRMIRRENKRLKDVMLRLRHARLQTTDEVYAHFRRRQIRGGSVECQWKRNSSG